MPFILIALAVAAGAAYTDLRTGLIPNWLTLPVIALAPLAHLALAGWSGLGASLVGLLVCALGPFLGFLLNQMGGGDVKLFAAIGALSGVHFGIDVLTLSFVLAFVWVLLRLTWRGELLALLVRPWVLAVRFVTRHRGASQPLAPIATGTIRFGGAIFLATALTAYGSLQGVASLV